jgi:hypothetical protein
VARVKEIVGHAYREDRQYNIINYVDDYRPQNYYELDFKSDVGDEMIGNYWYTDIDTYEAYFPNARPPVCFHKSNEAGVIKWLLDKHAEWLDKQFELAFSS